MIRKIILLIVAAVSAGVVSGQTPAPAPIPGATTAQTRSNTPFDLAEYGVQIQPDPRLIVIMGALDAAGFDPVPPGKEPSAFRQLLRKDQVNLDADLRERLRAFYQRNKLPAPATAADQAARYVSLAYA